MNKQHKIIATIGAGVAGLALIGAGAGATFTDATHSSQHILAGTMDVRVGLTGGDHASFGKTVTLPDASPTNSTFQTAATEFEIWNNSNITVQEVWVNGSAAGRSTAADDALFNQTNVCIYSPNNGPSNPGGVVYDGKLSNFVATGQQVMGPLAPGATDHYTAEFYAGNVTTQCGAETTASLDNSAQGGTITPQVDVSYNG